MSMNRAGQVPPEEHTQLCFTVHFNVLHLYIVCVVVFGFANSFSRQTYAGSFLLLLVFKRNNPVSISPANMHAFYAAVCSWWSGGT